MLTEVERKRTERQSNLEDERMNLQQLKAEKEVQVAAARPYAGFTPDTEATPTATKPLAPIHSHVKPLCRSHRMLKRRAAIVSASSLFFLA
ncbi:unnamed protein product [Pleuronectes platessa]|uniref:Uncharacterized protein n=1 Tax=Pleuronectes platessa TaxID=8262 RepID=A0A9N7U4Q7_PLEPL|nr:unnamed protein product [Pleuronectes platessa]